MNNAKSIIDRANLKLSSQKNALSKAIKSVDYIEKAPTPSSVPVTEQPVTVITSMVPTAPPTVDNSGYSRSGKLYQIVDFLKRQETTQSFEDIQRNLNGLDLANEPDLLELVKTNPKIIFDHDRQTLAYRPTHDVKSKADLLKLLKVHHDQDLGGMHMRDLKDTWSGLNNAIKELELCGQIFVMRQTKKEKVSVLFYNGMPSVLHTMPEDKRDIRQNLKQFWQEIAVPEEADLERDLKNAGLKLMPYEEPSIEQQRLDAEEKRKEKKKKPRKGRHIKITNVHLKDFDLTVDYQPVGDKKKADSKPKSSC